MRYDITLSNVVSIDVYDEAEARDYGERIASRLEIAAEEVAGSALISPPPLAVVEGVDPVSVPASPDA